MKLSSLNRKKEVVSVLLLAVSAVLIVVILFKVTSTSGSLSRGKELVAKIAASVEPNKPASEKYFADRKAVAEGLKKKNLFVPPVPPQNPVKEVAGILGDEALINGQWYKAGSKVGDANVVAIMPTYVMIEWKGEKKQFAPMSASSGSPAGEGESRRRGPEERGPVRVETSESKTMKARTEVVNKESTSSSSSDDLSWMGSLSEKAKAVFSKGWNQKTDEQKQQAKDEWNKMPEERKQQAVDAINHLAERGDEGRF